MENSKVVKTQLTWYLETDLKCCQNDLNVTWNHTITKYSIYFSIFITISTTNNSSHSLKAFKVWEMKEITKLGQMRY